jgi:co-chaperonin GroES (HSP10)
MNNPKQWLRDVVVVKFTDNGYKGHLILPPGIKHSDRVGTAQVVAIGKKFRHADDIAIGDYIYVDTYLGNRRTLDDLGDVVTYDGEDVIAKVI